MSLLQLLGVLLDTTQEVVTALRVLHVLNTHIDALFEVAIADALVKDNPNGRLGNVVDDTGATRIRRRYTNINREFRS
ncbi:hypothetical protein BC936DRAFT_143729 [Jimgerdemannia flammicorona]|uniref:Uncharacterized protein n=2 Tax=Jimgerdemannia flammicorona TaxID=994334 RepID=A0A433QMR3_9FUNG|nr:hypothetical protein BC936DRAFT_143729 [Jimgerdemannia flammicorona]RUS31071.1 hypothetical protein BC938DRAFT_478519 [Jimgerdemannia flammicorona]